MRHAYGTIGMGVPLRMTMALYAALLVMVPKHVAVPVEARAALADLAGISDVEQDAFMMAEDTDETTTPAASAPPVAPWRAPPAPPAPGRPGATFSDVVADLVRTFGWQPLIYLGSFAGAIFIMLIAWWRIARAVTLDNRQRPPEWDMY